MEGVYRIWFYLAIAGVLMLPLETADPSRVEENTTKIKLIRMRKLIVECLVIQKHDYLYSKIINSDKLKKFAQNTLTETSDLLSFVNNEGLNKKILYLYCQNFDDLVQHANFIKLVNSFVEYYISREIPADNGEGLCSTHFVCLLRYIDSVKEDPNFKFVKDKLFLVGVAREEALLEQVFRNRMEAVLENKFNPNDERRFHEKLFIAIDSGTFNKEIKQFSEWEKTETNRYNKIIDIIDKQIQGV